MRVWPARHRLLLRTPMASRARARAVVRWARALVPAVTLIITPYEGSLPEEPNEDDAIVLEIEDVAAGPLSLADAIAKALKGDR